MFIIYRLLFLALNEKGLNGKNHSSLNSHQPIKLSLYPANILVLSTPYSIAIWKTLYAFQRRDQHCKTLSWFRSQFVFSESLDFMLDLSFNFKQSLMYLFWALGQLINTFLIFYLCLGTKHYMHSQRKVGSLHCIIIYVKGNWNF